MANLEGSTPEAELEAFQKYQREEFVKERGYSADVEGSDADFARDDAEIDDAQIETFLEHGYAKDRSDALRKINLLEYLSVPGDDYKRYAELLVKNQLMTRDEIDSFVKTVATELLRRGASQTQKINIKEFGIMTEEEIESLAGKPSTDKTLN